MLICLLPFFTKAQVAGSDISFYNTHTGLPHEHVTCLVQDVKGFVWIGTNNGLVRYDGHQFKNMLIDDHSRNHSYSNSISALLNDSQRLWVSSMGGVLGYFDLENSDWNPVTLPLKEDGKPYAVFALATYQETLYVGTTTGELLKIDHRTQTTTVTKISDELILHIDVFAGELLVSTANTFQSIPTAHSGATSIVSLLDSLASPPLINGNTLLQRGLDYQLFLEARAGQVFSRKLALPTPNTRLFTSRGQYIAVGNEQLFFMNRKADRQDQLSLQGNIPSVTASTVTSVLCTGNGVTWIGTYTGLIKLVRNHYHFKKYNQGSRAQDLSFNYVRSAYATKDALWIGSKVGNVCRMPWPAPGEAPSFQRISISVENQEEHIATVNTFLSLSDGSLLAAGLEGVWIYRNDSFVPLLPIDKYPALDYPQVWAMAEDSLGRIWIGTLGNGILRLDLNTPKVEVLSKGGPEGLQSATIWTFHNDRFGHLWAGTQSGLYRVAYDRFNTRFVPLSDLVQDSLAGKEIWHLTEDQKGNLWIGSTDRGLAYYDRELPSLRNYSKANGLSNETVAGLQLEQNGTHLWVSTMDGLFALHTETQVFKEWRIEDGLLSNEFNFKAAAMAPNGELFLGSKSGLLRFNPKDIQVFSGRYPLHICELRVNNLSRETRGALALRPNERHFSATFALLEYAVTPKHRFRHRIKDFSEQWTYTEKGERRATYTNLPPGNYILEVEASLGKEWQTAGATQLAVDVPARWVERTWFWAVLAILLLAVVALWQRGRVRRIREKARIQVTIADLERRMLTAQMSPHFLFNSMNAIQQFVLCNESEAAQEYLGKFSKLIRMYLEASKRKLISLRDEIELLSTYIALEQVRFENRFEVRYEIDEALPLDEIEIPTSLIQPFVENAILHGLAQQTNGLLLLQIKQTAELLQIVVDDNGPGREATKAAHQGLRHKAQGMSLASELAHSYEGLEGFPTTEINIIDKKNKNGNVLGTQVIISMNLC